jgi:hypothetical protein
MLVFAAALGRAVIRNVDRLLVDAMPPHIALKELSRSGSVSCRVPPTAPVSRPQRSQSRASA